MTGVRFVWDARQQLFRTEDAPAPPLQTPEGRLFPSMDLFGVPVAVGAASILPAFGVAGVRNTTPSDA